jgi:UDP-2,4-diacetamido-2,4,6-trideoxy-beta-L-altropyranose hydrolase
MRQITLGAALKSVGMNPILFCFSIPDSLIARAHHFGLTVNKRSQQSNSIELSEEILSTNCSTVVFDGYEFTQKVITDVFNQKLRVVLIDDNGDLANFPCHIILNQNLHANPAMYESNKSSPQLLLGLSWALIRPEVVAQIATLPTPNRAGILLTIGGTDHLGITTPLLEGLKRITHEEVIATTGVLTGATLTPLEMAYAMARTKIGIIACGTTTWEAICLTLPFVGLVTAENQVMVGNSLVAHGIAPIFDCRFDIDIEKIIETVKHLQEGNPINTIKSLPLIDGGGALRSAIQIKTLTQ